jgi:hypothetical protein
MNIGKEEGKLFALLHAVFIVSNSFCTMQMWPILVQIFILCLS